MGVGPVACRVFSAGRPYYFDAQAMIDTQSVVRWLSAMSPSRRLSNEAGCWPAIEIRRLTPRPLA